MTTARVNEIFTSIDGEANPCGQGHLSTFVRFSGCDLACKYCDTHHEDYFEIDFDNLLHTVKAVSAKSPKLTITGGEPLLQKEAVKYICENFVSKSITIETNGAHELIEFDVPSILRHIYWVVDLKLTSSGMSNKMRLATFEDLSSEDMIKFVVSNVEDLNEAELIMRRLRTQAKYVVSPVMYKNDDGEYNLDWARTVTNYVVRNSIPAIVSVQMHKILGMA